MAKQPEDKPKRSKSTAKLTVVDGGKTPKVVRAGPVEGIKTGAKKAEKPQPNPKLTAPRQPRCYESHKPYRVAPYYFVHGGSCFSPVKGCDVYVALDGAFQVGAMSWAWTAGHEIYFPIRDRHAPISETLFKDLIRWLAKQLYEKAIVHVGCIGGHGRTGLVLAALHAHMTKDPDAITHVRENYCNRAVESDDQVEFLVKHFGCKAVAASHSYGGGGSLLGGKFKPSTHVSGGSGQLFDDLHIGMTKFPTVTTVKDPTDT